jgi:carbohydrate diacid regulator
MKLVSELAEKIINEVQSVMTENIIVVNQEGVIIASTEQRRVGFFHEGAKVVMNTKQKLYITYEMSTDLQGVKPGINLPIIFEEEVIGVIGITGIPTNVEPFAEIIRRMTELIIREASYIEKKEWETRGLESFFYEWIFNDNVDNEFINRGQILGISFDIPYQCILFQIDTSLSPVNLQLMQTYMNDWFDKQFPKNKNDFLIRWGTGRFIMFKSTTNAIFYAKLLYELSRWQEYFTKKYDVGLAIGVGKTIEHQTISTSYQEAKKALKVAEKELSVVFYDSLLLDIILEEVSEATKADYIRRVLSPVIDDSELIDTLRIYYANNQSLKKTANDLHIHINTLHYRLKQIKNLTRIDPKSSEGVTLFYVALSLV